VIHLYAVVVGLAELPTLGGVGNARLERMGVGELELVYSESDLASRAPGDEDVLRHALVVEELMARSAAILPGRLGQRYEDTAELERSVRAESTRLAAALQQVAGCVELGLRVLEPPHTEHAALANGTAYLQAKLAEKQAAERRVLEVHEPLARLARASTRRDGALEGQLLEAAYLVPAGELDGFRDELERIEASRADLDFVFTGPWPPYSFAAEALRD
jgi:hypothetical protein